MTKNFSGGMIDALAKLLGDQGIDNDDPKIGTGADITHCLHSLGLEDNSDEQTKWRRLRWIFTEYQKEHGSEIIFEFIKNYLSPTRFLGRKKDFETYRQQLNDILSFEGLEYTESGKFQEVVPTTNIDEATQRELKLQNRLKTRQIHPEVLKYCTAELMNDDYFHAVSEAAKGLADRIRTMSGVDEDNAKLVDSVLMGGNPIIRFNAWGTETDKSEHKGIAALFKGCFAAARNPRAHKPRILWQGEDDSADYLSLISLLHRKLDESTVLQRDEEQ